MRPSHRISYPDPGGPLAGVFVWRPPEYRPRWWLHLLLLALTVVTTTFWGGLMYGWGPEELLPLRGAFLATFDPSIAFRLVADPRFLVEGVKFSLPLLFILLCHEMGHYLACRRHGLVATPPFFIPAPIGIGTFGAVIRIKEPIRNTRQLLDVGAAGPLAGFVALLPVLLAGVALSRPEPVTGGAGYYLAEPLLFRLAAWLCAPALPEGHELLIHPVGAAAWFGILVTLLNLAPFAQLDGGHVAYALFGRIQQRLSLPLLLVLLAGAWFWPGWLVLAAIVLVMGVKHPPLADEGRPLDPARRVVAWSCFVLLALCFMVAPIRLVP